MAVINLDPENIPAWQTETKLADGTVYSAGGTDTSSWFSALDRTSALKAAGVFTDAALNSNSLMNASRAQSAQYLAQAAQYEANAFSAESKKVEYDYQAKLARLNAQSGQRQLYQIYRQGEWQAMAQGIVDAEKVAQSRVKTAARGVRLGHGSAALVEQTERLAAWQNQKAIQISTINAANAQRTQVANSLAQAYIAEGNSKATEYQANIQNIMADAAKEIASINLKYSKRMAIGNLFTGALSAIGTYSLSVNQKYSSFK